MPSIVLADGKDAAHAGLIVQRGPTSRRVDFRCLRKSCARILIDDIRLTMDLYGELGEDDLFHELPGRFPVPRMFETPRGDAGPSQSASPQSGAFFPQADQPVRPIRYAQS